MATTAPNAEAEWSVASTISSGSETSALAVTTPSKEPTQASDLELRLLQAFGEFASHKVVSSYLYVKQSSRLMGFLATTTEKVVTKTGLVALVGFLFAQYQRLGHPLVQYVDEAMGRRIIEAFVNLLLLAKQQQETQGDALLAIEDGSETTFKLSYHERLQAMLQGEVPRLQALLEDLQQREAEAQEKANNAPPVVVMDLQDFVSKDEVQRLQEQNHELLVAKEQEVQALKEQVNAVERARQQLEQDLTDVHNYQESERGRRFQDMEEELARTKLEASQKAHDLRKLELVVEGLRKKRSLKSKGSRSNLNPSIASSDTNEDNL